ncbi:MAG: hypothetical protein ABIU85_04830, partial [Methylotenera sp.]
MITEPIVNLRISVHCDPQINRDYLLLLDPIAISTTEGQTSGNQSMIANPLSNSQNKQQAAKSPAQIREKTSEYENTPVAPVKTIKKKKPNKRTSNTQSTKQKL